MPYVFKESRRPEPWRLYRRQVRVRLLRPVIWVEWLAEWAKWVLGRSALLEVLEYCGTLGIVFGVIFYFAGAKDRREQKHYQAWQVINTAQGKGGSGGRIDALQDLDADGVPLVGVDLSDAFLQEIRLPNADLRRANLGSADLRNADLSKADLEYASMDTTNFRGAVLRNALMGSLTDLTNADLNGADLSGVDFNHDQSGADFKHVVLDFADLRNTNLAGITNWNSIQSIKLANILGCKNAPAGFVDWALGKGAVQVASDEEWASAIASTRPSGSSK
jgi:Pentapeptide repeats (8 copies)